MSWLSRILTLPKSKNSIKDILGLELWQQWDRDLDNIEAFYKACTGYINKHPQDSEQFLRELLALLVDNARLLRQGLSTQDPFFNIRLNTRAFARKWELAWNG